MTKIAEYSAMLKKYKMKVTQPRVAVLEILHNGSNLYTADELFEKVNKKISSDRATIYRILHMFEKCHIVSPVQLKDGAVRYELAHEHGHHHHAVCTECGIVEHIADESAEKILHAMAKKLKQFNVVTDHSLEFFGRCKGCCPNNSSKRKAHK